ncbi:MAG: cellulase family glycosylhydrolase [Cyclobacteriaceae bacterium]
MRYVINLLSILIFCSAAVYAQNRESAFEMNDRLGKGINMGNAFEAPTETEWGNPWRPEYFKIMSELGFSHVRLPIRWETDARSQSTPPYEINPLFLERIKEVIDTALKYELYIIINMHHHELLFEDPEGQKDRFLAQWQQIGAYFSDYSDSLLFEVLNEPHGNLSPALWNIYFSEALERIRETNPTRMVLMGTADFGGLSGVPHIELPDDPNIILSVHFYNPFTFTHQGASWVGSEADEWLGTEWHDTEADREAIEHEFRETIRFSEENDIPIHVGEFGAYSTADLDSRIRWTTYLARWFEMQNFSWAYWEFSAGFGIYNPSTQQLLTPLVDALLTNEMPDPVRITANTIYESNFESSLDGWSVSTQASASATISRASGNLIIDIPNGGSDGWHVQLTRGDISLKQGSMYRISFKASAASTKSGTFYAGKASSPWTAYSGYNGISLAPELQEFSYTFTMNSATDNAARLVYDLGMSAVSNITITEVKVEELSFLITTLDEKLKPNLIVYPNPTQNVLYVSGVSRYHKAVLLNARGEKISTFDIRDHEWQLNMDAFATGLYIVQFVGDKISHQVKVLKQ